MASELHSKQLSGNAEPQEPRLEQPPAGSREAHERALDKTLADTFPASDPLSSIPDPSVPDASGEDPKAA
jgi:hypothetical protein